MGSEQTGERPRRRTVHLVWHVHEFDDGEEDVKLIGCYTSREKAEAAVERASKRPGFAGHPGGFVISKFELNKDEWVEGFVTVPAGEGSGPLESFGARRS